jgi:hypothetical protein
VSPNLTGGGGGPEFKLKPKKIYTAHNFPTKSMTQVQFRTPPGGLHLTRGGGGGGVRNSVSRQKPLLHVFTSFSHFYHVFFRGICEQTDANFKNQREVFSQHRLRNKNLFHFLQRVTSRESRRHLRGLFFQICHFPFQSRFCRSCHGQLGTNFAKPKEVFVQHMPIYNKLFHFSPRCHH